MGTRRDVREAEKRKKQKVRRADKGARRKAATPRERAGAADAAAWPDAQAWISDNWHEPGAHVRAVFGRAHSSGACFAAAFDVDLSGPGLGHVALGRGRAAEAIAEWGGQTWPDVTLLSMEPAMAARLVQVGLRLAAEAGSPPTGDVGDLRALLGDLDPDDTPYEFEVRFAAPEPAPEDLDTEEVSAGRGGLLGLLDKLLGR